MSVGHSPAAGAWAAAAEVQLNRSGMDLAQPGHAAAATRLFILSLAHESLSKGISVLAHGAAIAWDRAVGGYRGGRGNRLAVPQPW